MARAGLRGGADPLALRLVGCVLGHLRECMKNQALEGLQGHRMGQTLAPAATISRVGREYAFSVVPRASATERPR
eukprot:7885751-Heterocapsa_arctica.AAC.1